ncbi:MAG: hypothetical protein BGO69_00815 [Bacteroidetes bacterium 46-16]|nr:MAG: hypothetical protein BGO69_00815 [Bacteroidetes bacterium 46-16]
MRIVIAILVMISLTFQTMVKVAIIGWYELNKDYIAKNLCENRDKPQMKCCGKCYLHKQLKKAEDGSSNDKQGPSKTTKIELAEFVIPHKINIPYFTAPDTHQYNPAMQHMHGFDPLVNIFHPPAMAC